jgi:hypothetical protein
MKYVNALIFTMYLLVYGYSAYKTSVDPSETYWAYICIFTIGYLFMRTVKFVINLPDKKSEKKPEDSIAN